VIVLFLPEVGLAMSAGSSPEDASGQFQSRAADEAPSNERPLDPALLERVVRQTLAGGTVEEPLRPEEMDAMREVARRRQGEPLGLDPVATELVDAVLRTQFGNPVNAAGIWQALCRQVAETVMDDPVSHQRLESLWSSLSGHQP
jgi:hypothetical protein